MHLGLIWLALALLALTGCQQEQQAALVVHRELVSIAAPSPPANPTSKQATPAAYNRARFLRYRAAVEPGAVQAIVVCVPGVPAGAMAYDELARRLVRLSGGRVEVWAIDRRANLLEDLTGMQAAEQARDPDLAWRYYDDNQAINGRTYQGLPTNVSYMSEWGMATAVADLRAVLALVPAADRRRAVVLVGHSFGAAMAQAFAAWDLGGGRAAADELAGLVLMDGGLQIYKPPSEQAYLKKGNELTRGLEQLRAGSGVFMDYYGFGVEAFLTVEITAHRAWLDPDKLVTDNHVKRFATLIFLNEPPPMTATALVGFAIDDASSPLRGMRARCGAPDGPVESFTSPLTKEQRIRPADSKRTYGWLDFDQVTPPELTSVRTLARVAHEGPTNRLEWFFPSRLLLDTAAVSKLNFDDQGWQARYGLRATRAAAVDAPVLTVMAGQGLARTPSKHHWFRDLLATRVGAARPRAGAARSDNAMDRGGFAELTLAQYAHDDLIHASSPGAEAELYRPLLDWVLSNTTGERTIKVQSVVKE